MKLAGVPVEVRMWRCHDPENHLLSEPVAEYGALSSAATRAARMGSRCWWRRARFTPLVEEAFAATLLVLSPPTVEETAVLKAAVAAGYVVEPRVVGEPWRDTPITG